MTDNTTEAEGSTAVRVGEAVIFRLQDGARPLEYPEQSTVLRVSYDMGVNVIHTGTIAGIGYYGGPDGPPALALDDDTVVALDDIDADSFTALSPEVIRTFEDES